jgi:hypothetical protein
MNYIDKYNGVFIECGPSKVLSGLAKANNIDNIYSTSSSNFVNEIKELICPREMFLYQEPLEV